MHRCGAALDRSLDRVIISFNNIHTKVPAPSLIYFLFVSFCILFLLFLSLYTNDQIIYGVQSFVVSKSRLKVKIY